MNVCVSDNAFYVRKNFPKSQIKGIWKACKKTSPCPDKSGKARIAYALLNIQEYFATLATCVLGYGCVGIGNAATYDKVGADMINKAFSPPDSTLATAGMDPRFGN